MQAPPYHESLRPQFHFSPKAGWTNDPNGLVYFKGEYHLFFQHNPFGTEWGNMTWGHAVSKDLVRWTQLDEAIRPDALGTIFSGSAVVDHKNTSGFGSKGKPPLVCIYTAAGGTNPESKGQPFTQCLAYTLDGRTFTKYSGNPVLPHIAGENRDPKVLWHEPTKRWVMALYLEGDKFALFASPDLKAWNKLCDVPMPGCGECPDFFEMKIEESVDVRRYGGMEVGDSERSENEREGALPPHFHTSTPPHKGTSTPPHSRTTWVFWAANGRYRIGSFDGKVFRPETNVLQADWGPNSYAAQTYSDAPGGRRIQISWMQGGKYPGMPFNQQMSFPRELTLRETPEGPRLCMAPVKEIAKLRAKRSAAQPHVLSRGEKVRLGSGELWEVRLAFERPKTGRLKLAHRGAEVLLDFGKGTVSCVGKEAPLAPGKGPIDLTVLFDRTSAEVFAYGGRVVLAGCFLPQGGGELELTFDDIQGETTSLKLTEVQVWPSKSAW